MNPDLVPDGVPWRPGPKRKPSGSWRTNLIRRIAPAWPTKEVAE